jgi:17 kDa outer membrane surface antigen
MTNAIISDETLMALADGELAQADAIAVRATIAADPELAARFAAFVETRMLLQEPTATATEATPRRLTDAILRHDSVGPAPAAQHARWRLPMAAAIAFALGGLVGSFIATRDAGRDFGSATDILSVPVVRAAVSQALDRATSGSEVAWSDPSSGLSGHVLMVATQQLSDGAACREYEISYRGRSSGSVVAASCRQDDTWRTEIALFRSDRETGYTPASGIAAVEQYLTDRGGSGALSADDEKTAIAQGWRTRR